MQSLARDEAAAVAAVYAVSLVGLIAIGGVGFDYARMAGLDSELQNSADQAALAAVTQLDGQPGACSRAAEAAVNLLSNLTMLANDGAGNRASVFTESIGEPGDDRCDELADMGFITYYSRYDNANSFTLADTDEDARVVKVDIAERTARYAFTPIVGAVFPTMDARAVAGLGSAICKVPPLMMCQNSSWNITEGAGVRLVAGGGGSWTPGNFGYLEVNGPGAKSLENALGANIPLGDCQNAETVTTEPGAQVSVTDAINTRFDIFESGLSSYCAASGGKCSPAEFTRSDLSHTAFTSTGNGNGNGNSAPNCALTGNEPWRLAPEGQRYLPDPATGVQATVPAAMGLPRDKCHAVSMTGNCSNGRFGNGAWDRATYLAANYTATEQTALQGIATGAGFGWANITRYQMYQTEILARRQSVIPASRATFQTSKGNGGGGGGATQYYSFAGPKCAPAAIASDAQPDRRVGAVAVIDCGEFNDTKVNGKASNIKVLKWVQMFFVEPSLDRDRTSKGDIYVEIIKEVNVGEGGGGLPVRKDKPFLIE